MPKKTTDIINKNDSKLQLDVQYHNLLNEIKLRLKKAQLRAAIAVNHELIQLYWEIVNG